MADQLTVDLEGVLDAWPIPAPRSVRLADAGTNNRSAVINTPAGSYLLRVYQNTSDLERIQYEHALLLQLARAGLSFAVPHPLSATNGKTCVIAAQDGDDLVAALFPMIPGREPVRGSVTQTSICGEALGELDRALASIKVKSAFVGMSWFGQPGTIHPLVSDPVAAIAQLPFVAAHGQRVAALLGDLSALAPRLYERIPAQIIHGDFFPSNVLLGGNAVNGVLDFEFASPGPRAMDVAIGLWGFAISGWRNGGDWPLIDAFAAGYQRRIMLSPDERGALPDLIRLREATSLIHWIGRFRQGLTSGPDIARRADRLLQLDEWMHAHGRELVLRVEQAAPKMDDYVVRD